eukprot:CAMPEP_0171455466 /NCGR_PEP_ID=MMETSP0945-20130129/2350_1 /TAXON_ID=109269 /ORGANISM="Vaucheria litorea, Strain CCMP2940" /LENGTH=237 /DNA_ID=CAMNT_0011980713 /DNA_START=42 /DNA_END=755 /DNA_ORIENTATION=-
MIKAKQSIQSGVSSILYSFGSRIGFEGQTPSNRTNYGDSLLPPQVSKSNGPERELGTDKDPSHMKDMIDNLSKKLNSSEIKMIISLKESLKKVKGVAKNLEIEKNELSLQLKVVTEIKDDLDKKLKLCHKLMMREKEEKKQIAKQIASDAEVISFTDVRLQELEKVASESMDKATKLQEQLEEERSASVRKAKAQEELNFYEREKLEAEASELREVKKVLVSEVKKLRQEIQKMNKA